MALLTRSARRWGLAIMLLGAALPSARAQLVGLWEFDNAADLGQATIGTDLTFEGAEPTYSASLADDSANSLSGVITTAAAIAENRIRADHGIAPNGGGSFVNQYTIVTDIFSPTGSRDSWRTIYQTNTGNSNDGEYFIRPDNDALGVGALTYSTPDVIDETAWTRLVLTVDLASSGNDVTAYLDGSLFYQHPSDAGVDGRHSLDPFLYFFTDENGDNAPLNVGTLAMFDRELSSFQVEALGVAGDPIAFTPNPVLTLEIDRDTGSISINNDNLGAAQEIKGYSILSSNGALIEGNFTPLSDGDSNWVQLTETGATGDLSEGHLTTGSIADGATVTLDDGANGTWLRYFDESDITFEYLNGNNELIQGDVIFAGTTQTTAYAQGDLNFDGVIDGLDWNQYVADLGSPLPGLSPAQAYRRGDLTGDGINNHADFLAFKGLFDAANGPGAFQAMIGGSSVPEPGTLALLAVAGLAWGCRRLATRVPVALVVAVAALVVVPAGSTQAQLSMPEGVWQFDNNLDNDAASGTSATASGFTPAYTNTTIFGQSATVIDLPDFPANEGLQINNGAAANPDGAAFTNNFTLVIDINVPDVTADFTSILQTNATNANDVDVFARPGNDPAGVDIGGLTTTGVLASNTWYRMTLVNENAGGSNTTSLYMDGTFVDSVNNGGTDGTFSLEGAFFLFADNNGENNSKLVNSVGYWDEALTALEISSLGGATADGINVDVTIPGLTINVNKTTGNVTLINESGADLPGPINFYEIISGDGLGEDGLLSTAGWNSLSNQSGVTTGIDPVENPGSPTPGAGNDPGETWDEGGGIERRPAYRSLPAWQHRVCRWLLRQSGQCLHGWQPGGRRSGFQLRSGRRHAARWDCQLLHVRGCLGRL